MNDLLYDRANSTGLWLIDGQAFASLKSGDRRSLWMYGPGEHTSLVVLLAVVLNARSSWLREKHSDVSFLRSFFCRGPSGVSVQRHGGARLAGLLRLSRPGSVDHHAFLRHDTRLASPKPARSFVLVSLSARASSRGLSRAAPESLEGAHVRAYTAVDRDHAASPPAGPRDGSLARLPGSRCAGRG